MGTLMGPPANLTPQDSAPLIELVPVSSERIHDYRLLNLSIFPIRYSDQFYKHVISTPDLTRLAYCGCSLIGGVTCRIESNALYIMTLGVVPVWRGVGIGRRLLQFVVNLAESHPELDNIYLHVQTTNADAIRFYTNQGFHSEGEIKNYYRRVSDPDCFVLRRWLRPSPH
eukprot:TRINITY_DN9938_c0_g1::TRINITY_DN9938_c0_g1_i1::g.29277::m.29277 TRINITY_DN9938_c0_g1::TRINITY_DN9938_c0_g1_i1::g.29277  ORF type:complete len:170 (+),score=-8.85,sp/Q6DBY2/NAA50_DANRE/42.67/1e-33,Acetyltransf_1/PF00583.19/4.2e-14,Acetyltransf_8/PF13523.1/1.7e-07,Acetyltransf_7/PF13508.1/3.1e-07,Acetyltransf_4/PF13420.1/3.6e-06,Acetyltransf_10/PF13673.1/3.1e-05,FR47/PF08445.5/0.0021,DUF3749/PF12568.3/0.016,Acetyltransf_3/PF13302.1/0.037 TRINITY_DN9938_c0_g1_i1:3-512(+)